MSTVTQTAQCAQVPLFAPLVSPVEFSREPPARVFATRSTTSTPSPMLVLPAKLGVLHAKPEPSVMTLRMDTFWFLLEFLNQDVWMESTSSTEPVKSAQALVPPVNHQLNARLVLPTTTSTNNSVLAHAPTDTSPTASESAQPAQSDAPTVSAPTTAQPVATPTSNSRPPVFNNALPDTSPQAENVSNATAHAQPAQALPPPAQPVPLDSCFKETPANLPVTLPTTSTRAPASDVKLPAHHALVEESTNVPDAMTDTS